VGASRLGTKTVEHSFRAVRCESKDRSRAVTPAHGSRAVKNVHFPDQAAGRKLPILARRVWAKTINYFLPALRCELKYRAATLTAASSRSAGESCAIQVAFLVHDQTAGRSRAVAAVRLAAKGVE